MLAFFSSPGLLSVLEAKKKMFKRLSVVSFINTINKPSVKKAAHIPRGFLAAAVVVVRVDPAVRTGAVVLLAAVAADALLLAEPV